MVCTLCAAIRKSVSLHKWLEKALDTLQWFEKTFAALLGKM